jgi:Cys-tRNA synthase (O-phospho-L-seryl-tRNA:Cys-tRNA synthase)
MSTVADLLAEIEAFCREVDIAEATFGTRAAKDGKFVKRLREGAGVTIRTVDNVRAYIAAERAKNGARPTSKRRAA